MTIERFLLINADSGKEISTFNPLIDGAVINLTAVGRNLSIRANCDPCRVGSVVWTVNGAPFFIANDEPYALLGQTTDCRFNGWQPVAGSSYVITATPFSGSNGSGLAGTASTITISFIEGGVVPQGGDGGSGTGWTVFTESADTKKYYVSNSGSDSNDGLTTSTPFLTFAKARSLFRANMPDWVYLKRGDTFTEEITFSSSGKSDAEPKLISYYGASGNPPKINREACWTPVGSTPINHVAFVGVHFYWSKKDPASGDFDPGVIGTLNGTIRAASPMNGLLVESCWFEFCHLEVIAKVSNLRIRRNVFRIQYNANSDPTKLSFKAFNLYVENGAQPWTFEENICDYGGWHPTLAPVRTFLSHNLYGSYLSGPCRCTGNIFCRGAGDGSKVMCGGIVEDNLYINCPMMGSIAESDSQWNDNVVLGGADLDSTSSGDRGIGPDVTRLPKFSMSGNVIASKLPGVGLGPALSLNMKTTAPFTTGGPSVALPVNPQVSITGNVFYRWHGSLLIQMFDGSLTVTGNKFSENTATPVVDLYYTTAALHFSGDAWYSTSAPNQRMKINGDYMSFTTWQARTADSSTFVDSVFADPGRTVESYNVTIGGTPNLDNFMTAAKAQWKENWGSNLQAHAVNEYVRAGYGL